MLTTRPETTAQRRARAIAEYDVVERPANPELQAIADLTAHVCRTPMSTINLITDVEQFHVAAHGIDPMVCHMDDAMCSVVLDDKTPVVVADCRDDSRFADHPFVNGDQGEIRFYASHLLRTREGVVIGTLCVYDLETRELDRDQVEALAILAERVVDVLELSLRSRQLATSNDRLAAFAARVTHDLKTPLASLTMSLGMLRDQLESADDPHEARWLLDRALRGSNRMTAMIDQILDHASTGGLALTPVDLESTLTSVLDELAAVPGGVDVMRLPLPTVVGDEILLRTVLQNLVDNAVKYRHPDRPLQIKICAARRPGRWRIQVVDNGIGIATGERERVFEPRVRLDTPSDVSGSGIGLDTCRQVISDHGGRIGIEDGIDGGTTVWFELEA